MNATLNDVAILTIHGEFNFTKYIKSLKLARDFDIPNEEGMKIWGCQY